MDERTATGPYVIDKDGNKGDRNFWAAEMDPVVEEKFDNYLKAFSINKAAKKELARRKIQKTFESLMEAFNEDE